MKVAAVLGEHQAGLVEVPDPTPKEDWVVVKIHASPMCTEYHAFEYGHKTDQLGHEAAGEVVDIAQPGKVEIGDRVVVMPQYPCGKCVLCTDGTTSTAKTTTILRNSSVPLTGVRRWHSTFSNPPGCSRRFQTMSPTNTPHLRVAPWVRLTERLTRWALTRHTPC